MARVAGSAPRRRPTVFVLLAVMVVLAVLAPAAWYTRPSAAAAAPAGEPSSESETEPATITTTSNSDAGVEEATTSEPSAPSLGSLPAAAPPLPEPPQPVGAVRRPTPAAAPPPALPAQSHSEPHSEPYATSSPHPLCLPMPPPASLEVWIAALPCELYTGEACAHTDPGPDSLREMAAATIKWALAHDPASEYTHIDMGGVAGKPLKVGDIARALINRSGRSSPESQVVRSGVAGAAAAAANAALARFAAHATPADAPRGTEGYTYTTESWRDLERVVTAGLLRSPYTRFVDLRAPPAPLSTARVVFVPFGLARLRANPDLGAAFHAAVKSHVPTLWTTPAKHAFIIARILRDLARLPSLKLSLQGYALEEPFLSAQWLSFEPSKVRTIPRRQVTLPYVGAVRRVRAAVQRTAPPLTSAKSKRKQDPNLPIWQPGDPRDGANSSARCDPLWVRSGSLPPDGCTLEDAVSAVRASRPLLATFLGEPRIKVRERATAMHALSQCADCAVMSTGNSKALRGGVGMAAAYGSSVFCVHPIGDSPSRKAFFDSLLFGCIPVVLDRGDRGATPFAPVLPFSTSLSYAEFTVLLPRTQWNKALVPTLRAIPPATVRRMQRALAQVAHLLQFDAVSPGELTAKGVAGRSRELGGGGGCAQDAIDVLLRHWAHSA